MRSIHCRLGVADLFGLSFDLLARSTRSSSYDCVGTSAEVVRGVRHARSFIFRALAATT